MSRNSVSEWAVGRVSRNSVTSDGEVGRFCAIRAAWLNEVGEIGDRPRRAASFQTSSVSRIRAQPRRCRSVPDRGRGERGPSRLCPRRAQDHGCEKARGLVRAGRPPLTALTKRTPVPEGTSYPIRARRVSASTLVNLQSPIRSLRFQEHMCPLAEALTPVIRPLNPTHVAVWRSPRIAVPAEARRSAALATGTSHPLAHLLAP